MDHLTTASMHPMIQFTVRGFRTMRLPEHAIAKERPKPLPPEATREYHIGLTYPHKPKYEGIEYREQFVPGAFLSDEYMSLFQRQINTGYRTHEEFQRHMLRHCVHCQCAQGEMIDERKAPGA